MKKDLPPQALPPSEPLILSRPDSLSNTSGVVPLGRAVLLMMTETSLKSEIIVLPDGTKSRQAMLDSEGIVIAMGPLCGVGEPGEDGCRCKVGDRVVVAAMSGSMRIGADKRLYRIVNHRDIYARLEGE